MDRSQLVTIAVTTTVTIVVREVVSWLLSLAKGVPKSEKTRATAKIIFNKANRKAIWSGFWLVFTAWALVHDVREPDPITRFVVVRLVVVTGTFVFWLIFGTVEILIAIQNYRERKKLYTNAS